MKTFILRHRIWVIVGFLLLCLLSYYTYKKLHATTQVTQYITGSVTKGTLVVSVSGSGQVEASNQLEIKPQVSGTITSVKVSNGQQVKAGDVLVTIDGSSASNAIRQAQVSLMQAQANYDKLMAGTSDTDLVPTRLGVDGAKQALDKANADYNLAVTQQDQAVKKALANLYNDSLTAISDNNSSSAVVTVSGSYDGLVDGSFTINAFQTGGGYYYNVIGATVTSGEFIRGKPVPIGHGLYVTFSTTGNIDTSTRWVVEVPNKQSANYLSNLYTYNTALSNQTQTLQQAKNNITTAENNLKIAEASLDSKTTPPSDADVSLAKAQIASAQLALSIAGQDYAKTIIKAPFDGIVTAINARVGDQASNGTSVATVLTNQKIASLSLNEVDVAKVKLGQPATLTFDAIDGLTLTGKVVDVDTLGTTTQNVVTYTVKIALDTQDDRIKPGMSTNASIVTDVKPDVLMVPSSAVQSAGNSSYVQYLVNGAPVQHNVTVGLSNDTDTEVSGDIKEGDEIITQIITQAATTQSSGTSLLQGLGGGGNRTFGGAAAGATRTSTGGAGR